MYEKRQGAAVCKSSGKQLNGVGNLNKQRSEQLLLHFARPGREFGGSESKFSCREILVFLLYRSRNENDGNRDNCGSSDEKANANAHREHGRSMPFNCPVNRIRALNILLDF